MTELHRLNRALKMHDSCLYAQETKLGRFDVMRRSQFGGQPPHFIMALTENWAPDGRPVPWSPDVVVNRVKAHDLWRDDTFIERYIQDHEKKVESQDRAFRNSVEGFLLDFRRQFAKATSDINTSTLPKVDRRKEYENGHRQS